MTSKYTELKIVSLREMQVKTKIRYNFTPPGMAKLNRMTTPNLGKDVEELKLSNTAGRSWELDNYFGKLFGNFL